MLRSLKRVYHLLLAICANIWFGFPGRKLTVIGVTGTDGKTTTSTMIYHILKRSKKHVSMITSVQARIAGKIYDTGFHVTTPGAWQVQRYLREALRHGDTHVVLEVTSHALSQSRVFGVPFDVGVITNVTHEHLDWHGTFSSYIQTKLSLFAYADCAVINRDDQDLWQTFLRMYPKKRYVTYGIFSKADVSPKTHPLKLQLPGEFNIYNALAACAAAGILGIDTKTMLAAVCDCTGIPGRMEMIQEAPVRIIVDFAHTPNAIRNALHTVKKMTKGKLIHVFGSAGLRDASKRPLMGEASAAYADTIILTEEDYRTENVDDIIDSIAQGIPDNKTVYREPDRKKAVMLALSLAKKGDTLIVTGKGHERSLCRGKTEYPWSDQEELRRLSA